MRFVEPVFVTMFERKVPIRLVSRSMLPEIFLSHHVQCSWRRQFCVPRRLLSRFLPAPVRLSLLRRASVSGAMRVKRRHTTHDKRCHRHHHKKSYGFEFSWHNGGYPITRGPCRQVFISNIEQDGSYQQNAPQVAAIALSLLLYQLRTASVKRSRYRLCCSSAADLFGPRSNSTFSSVPLNTFGRIFAYQSFGTTGRPLSVPMSIPA